MCGAEDVRILALWINESLWWAKRWLDSSGLKMAPEKTEPWLVRDRRSFQHQVPGGAVGSKAQPWQTPSDRNCQVHPIWSKLGSAHAQDWWTQGSKEKTGGEHGAFDAALCSSGLGPQKTMLSRGDCSQRREVLC